MEFFPAVLDCLEQTGGTKVVERFKAGALGGGVFGPWYRLSPEERREWRATRPPWWALPTKNTLDRATALFPKLLYERLDEIGIVGITVTEVRGAGAQRGYVHRYRGAEYRAAAAWVSAVAQAACTKKPKPMSQRSGCYKRLKRKTAMPLIEKSVSATLKGSQYRPLC